MPRDEELREQDPAEWARKYEAMGGSHGGNPNNFQIAVLFYGSSLSAEAIEEVIGATGVWKKGWFLHTFLSYWVDPKVFILLYEFWTQIFLNDPLVVILFEKSNARIFKACKR